MSEKRAEQEPQQKTEARTVRELLEKGPRKMSEKESEVEIEVIPCRTVRESSGEPILQRILTLAAADTELRQMRRVVHPRPARLKIE